MHFKWLTKTSVKLFPLISFFDGFFPPATLAVSYIVNAKSERVFIQYQWLCLSLFYWFLHSINKAWQRNMERSKRAKTPFNRFYIKYMAHLSVKFKVITEPDEEKREWRKTRKKCEKTRRSLSKTKGIKTNTRQANKNYQISQQQFHIIKQNNRKWNSYHKIMVSGNQAGEQNIDAFWCYNSNDLYNTRQLVCIKCEHTQPTGKTSHIRPLAIYPSEQLDSMATKTTPSVLGEVHRSWGDIYKWGPLQQETKCTHQLNLHSQMCWNNVFNFARHQNEMPKHEKLTHTHLHVYAELDI